LFRTTLKSVHPTRMCLTVSGVDTGKSHIQADIG